MEINQEFLAELLGFYPDAAKYTEGGLLYVHLPTFTLPNDEVVGALLLLNGAGSYTTRLFLPKQIVGKGSNWSQHQILNKEWWTWSWKDVPSNIRYMEILANHVRALR
jgi:hypothetical protein